MHSWRWMMAGALGLGVVAVLGAWRPEVRAAGAEERVDEAIVLSGAQLAPFDGAAWDALWVYAWRQGDWQFAVGQLDDRDDMGQYVAGDGSGLDANDEYVFMAEALGERRPDGAWPPSVGRAHPAIEVKVTDPLRPGYEGYAYLFWSTDAPYPLVRPQVRFDADQGELTSEHYVVGFADPRVDKDAFIGLKRLSILGGTRNLIDRLKIRADVTFLGTRATLTEVELAAFGSDQFRQQPVKVGLLRAVLDPTGAGMAYSRRVALFAGLDRLGGIQPPIGQVELHDLRVSLDLAAGLGAVRYADANLPAGVPVDGAPDTVPTAPLPDWREMTFTEGRAVLVRGQPGAATAATVYYKDDLTQDSADTGDFMSFGDHGARAARVEDWASTGFPGELVVLSADDPHDAAGLVAQKRQPLAVTVLVGELPPTPGALTATPTPTPGAATATPTAGPQRHRVHLPWSRK